MEKNELVIKRKPLKGEDGYKTFSIRLKNDTVERLEKIASETCRSRNELINVLLIYAMDHAKVE